MHLSSGYLLQSSALNKEAAGLSKILVNFYQKCVRYKYLNCVF
jgi:hypothetical protein